ncbi:winged helix-turn-helix transcriptional regulator [Streptomyces bathyalis]|uniref:Winged helix-turn-helix transcriptional regulator n=1 Tax=Streptomyces bathyalis TaxID=2710756 RepID=A0A7T1T2U3_9ACTN|nr:helix-turn-helix domain-containing protein [Streptomyces bathyalis]QPP05343.1 winged helix-turn-helix transcriptional regulator [Streptomyces bathyalis]
MISFQLDVEDLADTRFAISPLQEALFSVWTLRDPGRYPLHLPWRRSVLSQLDTVDRRLLLSLVGETRALPDFLTPRPTTSARSIEEQLAGVRGTPPDIVCRDMVATHAPGRLPDVLHEVSAPGEKSVIALVDTICDLLQRYWDMAFMPMWPQMRLVLEADITHRARQLATGGARLLFSDMHPNLRWRDGVLHIDKMAATHRVTAAGRGLLLVPSVFAYKPVPPLSPDEPPMLAYPSRGIATLWAEAPAADTTALASLLGVPRARMLGMLGDPLSTADLAHRLRVTPSAVSQHLQVLYATGLVTRARDGRRVMYRRSPLGNQLAGQDPQS